MSNDAGTLASLQLTNADLLALFPDDNGLAVGNEPDISTAVPGSIVETIGINIDAHRDPKWNKYEAEPGEVDGILDGHYQHISGGAFDGYKVGSETPAGFDIFGGPLDDVIVGGPLGGNIFAQGGRSAFYGGTGNDILIGGRYTPIIEGNGRIKLTTPGEIIGSGYLVGSDGNDTIKGLGDDTLVGGPGVDLLTGVYGHDTFRFNPGDLVANHYDGILDFHTGEDKIDLRGFGPDATVAVAAFDSKLLLINPDAHGHSDQGIRVFGDHVQASDLLLAPGAKFTA